MTLCRLGRKWLVDFNARKTQLVSTDQSNNTGDIDMKMDGSVLDETSYFKMLQLTFSSKLDWGSKSASKKIGTLNRSMKFLSPEVVLISINLLHGHAWNTVVMSGLELRVDTWNC